MTEPFCRQCAERRLGPAAMEEARRSAAEAPDLRPEQVSHLRTLFASAPAVPAGARETRGKTCEHGEPVEELRITFPEARPVGRSSSR